MVRPHLPRAGSWGGTWACSTPWWSGSARWLARDLRRARPGCRRCRVRSPATGAALPARAPPRPPA